MKTKEEKGVLASRKRIFEERKKNKRENGKQAREKEK